METQGQADSGQAPRILPRTALIAAIRADGHRITLVQAPAGFGKSVLAGQLARAVGAAPVPGRPGAWDGPGWRIRDGVPPETLDGPERLVLLVRPGQVPSGLARARLHGEVGDIPAADLLFARETLPPGAWARSAGWPVLVGAPEVSDADLTAYLVHEVLADLPADRLLAATRGETDDLRARIPPLALADAPLRALLPGAVETALAARLLEDGPAALGWSENVLPPRPRLAARLIRTALAAGDSGTALDLFRRSGGWHLFYALPPRDFAALVDDMPAELRDRDEELALAQMLLGLKAGEVGWVRRRFEERFGGAPGMDVLDLRRGLAPDSPLSLRVQAFRIVLLIYEDIPVSEDMLDTILSVLSRLPLEAHLMRGSCHNALLEIYLRQRRYAELEFSAERSAQAYESANAVLLRFYIGLHRAVMGLLRGQSGAALPELADARAWLDKLEFDSPGDSRIARLVEAAARFEEGEAGPILGFLDADLDAFSGGETWPTLVELAVQFGSQALAEHVSTRAALAYLDRWWARLAMNRQFRVLLDLRKAQVLQNAGRWGEAARALSPIQARIDRVWIESADTEFARLATRDEILLALCWLRQIAYEYPRLPYLGRKLDHMAANPQLTGRQRIALDIWRAHVARQTREPSQMRALLRSVFDIVARDRGLSVLSEEQLFLGEMWRDAGTAAYLSAVGPARLVMRRLEESRFTSGTEAARAHLTRQELKVLMMLTEGASNKIVARQLGITEPTVKFHLKNLYAKLGCNRRAEAVRAARALGWMK